ncbi:unnamed protein product, partial [Brachionus calyciflorus]
IDYENESLEVMNDVENFLKNTKFIGLSDICLKITESIKANSQRHKYINEQLDETQVLIHKLFEHKEKYKNFLIISSTGGNTTTQTNSNINTNQTNSSQLQFNNKKTYNKNSKTLNNKTNKLNSDRIKTNLKETTKLKPK